MSPNSRSWSKPLVSLAQPSSVLQPIEQTKPCVKTSVTTIPGFLKGTALGLAPRTVLMSKCAMPRACCLGLLVPQLSTWLDCPTYR